MMAGDWREMAKIFWNIRKVGERKSQLFLLNFRKTKGDHNFLLIGKWVNSDSGQDFLKFYDGRWLKRDGQDF